MKVYIAAGHQGKGTGAHSQLVKNGVIMTFDEAEMTEKLVDAIKGYADNRVMYAPYKISLTEKIRLANKLLGYNGLALEFHFNTCGGTGAECVIADNASATSREVAEDLAKIISEVLGVKNRGVKRESQSARGKLGFLNQIKSPSVIVEVCFLDCLADMEKYQPSKYLVAEAVAEYINNLIEE